jgi:hypothetical protein
MVKPGSLMAMSSNITEPQNRQSFSFNATGTINDARFSGVNVSLRRGRKGAWSVVLTNFSHSSHL